MWRDTLRAKNKNEKEGENMQRLICGDDLGTDTNSELNKKVDKWESW